MLGKAIRYMQDHWETLTRFVQIEGAPLDNNLVERALKLFIRQRKNSLFYKSEHSAYIASVLTSLIVTCIYAGINVLDYLVALQEHRSEVLCGALGVVALDLSGQPRPALGHASPILSHLCAFGIAIPNENHQFASRQGHPCVRCFGPPVENGP